LFSRARGTIALHDDKVFLTTADAHIVALAAQTGKVIWDTAVADHRQGYTFTTLGKPGVLWAIDRRTGKFLWERETTYQNVYKHIDARTGDISLDKSLFPTTLDETKFVCPSDYGGKLWMAAAYNPASKTLFVPLNNLCMDWKIVAQEPTPGEDDGRGRLEFRHPPKISDIGRVDAINLDDKQTRWSQARRPYWTSSLLATTGGIVFGGDANRRLVAFDGASGNILWQLPLNSQPGGFPMTYMAGGKQYVAVPVGLSLIGNRASRQLTPEIPVPSQGSTLLVFALPDRQRR
jgi:glucose dehydrogenase